MRLKDGDELKLTRRRAVLMLGVSALVYVLMYGFFRHAKLYVRFTGSYRDGVRHSISAGRGAPIVTIPAHLCLYLHYPLKVIEETYWNRNRLPSYFNNGLR